MAEEIRMSIKHSATTLELALSPQATVMELQERLESETGVLVRRQKLMHKGKIISGAAGTLAAAGVTSGSKLMLLAAAGAMQSQGATALAAAQRTKVEQQQLRRQQASAVAGASAAPPAPPSMQARAEVWRKTGIASLRSLRLASVPPEVLAPSLTTTLRVLDLGGNQLAALPAGLAQLAALQRLRLSSNALEGGDEVGATWGPLLALTQLVVLVLDQNRLTAVPEGISRLIALERLVLSGNQLESLPACIGRLPSLRSLGAADNRLASLPSELGECCQLEEVDLSGNQIVEIPGSLGHLRQLRLLNLDANKIRTVPPELLRGCTSLASLSLHDNPITAEQLRETPGYPEFDARRRAKYDKQMGMKLHGEGFDEGVDIQEWEHWNP